MNWEQKKLRSNFFKQESILGSIASPITDAVSHSTLSHIHICKFSFDGNTEVHILSEICIELPSNNLCGIFVLKKPASFVLTDLILYIWTIEEIGILFLLSYHQGGKKKLMFCFFKLLFILRVHWKFSNNWLYLDGFLPAIFSRNEMEITVPSKSSYIFKNKY